jgi:hypothetical protein
MRDQVEARQGTRLPDSQDVKPAAEQVWDAVRRADETSLQNILMRMPDKVCAVAFAMLNEERREALFQRVAPLKAARIREEMRLESRRRTSALVRARIVRTFLAYFGEGERPSARIWIRPKGRSGPK